LTGNAGVAGAAQIAQMSDALEVLLRELYEKPENINPSTLRTVAAGVDFLGILFNRAATPGKPASMANIIAVDDDPISLRAVTFALEKAKLKAVGVQDPAKALTMLNEKKFDLVFLDVDMPEMSGFELCTKLRTGQVNKKTPVVFVTNLNDFENRANSTMSGGNDFIGKPFMFIELAVKALLHVLRGQLEMAKA
jgi:PleD family two-component response regulator